MFTTRQQLSAPLSRDALRGVSLHSTRSIRALEPITDEDVARVSAELGPEAAAGRLVRFVISTEERAADGHTIAAAGWDFESYRESPLVLFQHDRWDPRVADSVVWVDGDVVRSVAAFYPRDINELSYMLGEMSARAGHRASVGFDIVEAAIAAEEVRQNIPWALDISVARLKEWSLVNMGSDMGALADAREAGIDTAPLAAWAERLLDVMDVLAAGRTDLERLRGECGKAPPVVVDLAAHAAPTDRADDESADLGPVFAAALGGGLRGSFGTGEG